MPSQSTASKVVTHLLSNRLRQIKLLKRQVEAQKRDTLRLQFLLDITKHKGTHGLRCAVHDAKWTVYVNDGERSVIGFDRRAIDGMMKKAAQEKFNKSLWKV